MILAPLRVVVNVEKIRMAKWAQSYVRLECGHTEIRRWIDAVKLVRIRCRKCLRGAKPDWRVSCR